MGAYQFIGFDELTHISQEAYLYMFSRARKLIGKDVPLRIRSASNPSSAEDANSDWIYNRFINPNTRKPHTIFLPAGLNDNPYLDKESYLEMLNELDPITRAQLKDGVWGIKKASNFLKREWFDIVDELPPGRRKVRFWDIAATVPTKANKNPDYTCGCLLSEYQGTFYIEDFCAFKGRPEEVERHQANCMFTDGSMVPIREEQEPGASGVTVIDQKARGIFLGQDYKGIKSTGDKVERAKPVSAAAERGQIKIYKGCRNINLFYEQISTFPSKYYHDDTIDSLSGAFAFLGILPPVSAPSTITPVNGSYWDEEQFGESRWQGWRNR